MEKEFTVIRTIHSVGQGAFCTEEFHDSNQGLKHTVVFDCGSTTRIGHGYCINKVVSGTFSEKENIDVLFISHFDKDHVNGIKEIIKQGRSIDYIVLPQIDVYKWFYIIENICAYDESVKSTVDTISFIKDKLAEVSTSNGNKNMKILQVKPIPYEENYEGENDDDANINPNNIKTLLEDTEVDNNQSFIPSIDNIGGSNGKIDSGTVFSLVFNPSWIYIPINYTYDRDIQKLKRLLNKIIKSDTDYKEKSINSLSISKLCDFIINNRTKINNAYNSIFPNTNASSLCVYSCMLPSSLSRKSYSYYIHPNLVNRCCDPWCHIDKRIMNIEGCLYTGDTAMNS